MFIYSVVDAALKKAGGHYEAASDIGENKKTNVDFHGTKFRIMWKKYIMEVFRQHLLQRKSSR